MNIFRLNVLVILLLINLNNINGQISPEWTANYFQNFPFNIEQREMKADRNGNVYVTGYIGDSSNTNSIVIKYDSIGLMEWSGVYDSIGYYTVMAIDDSSNVYVMGNKSDAIWIIKYNSQGVIQWNKTYSMGGLWYWTWEAVTDKYNSLYIVGTSANNKYTTLKYDLNGNLVWSAVGNELNGMGKSYIDIDKDQNTYIAIRGGDTTFLCTTIKYDSLGVKKWEQNYSGNYVPGLAGPVDIKCDKSGYIYLLAETTNDNNGEGDIAVLKYDSAGNQKWATIYSNNIYYDVPYALAVDNQQNVYFIGNIHPGSCSVDAYVTVKIDSSGIIQWSKTYDIGGCNWDIPYSIAVDSGGNVFVTGESADTIGFENFATIKYDNNGSEMWVARFQNTPNCNSVAHSICLDYYGNVYVSGTDYNSDTTSITTIKYGRTVGINENDFIEGNSVKIFPNPFENQFSIEFKKDVKNVTLDIYDMYGKRVSTFEKLNGMKFSFENINFSKGIYSYKLYDDKEIFSKGKLIAE